MGISRREFVQFATSSGIALSMSRLALAQAPGFAARETLPGPKRWNPAATGAGRIDGPAKVTGAKLYASDFRAADLPGWPTRTSHALLVRATNATQVFTGLDLSRLTGALAPSRVVTAADLALAGIRVPAFYEGDLICPVGRTPLYLGQPLALLIFEEFDSFDQARLALRDAGCAKYGAETAGLASSLRFAPICARCRRNAGGARRLLPSASRVGDASAVREGRHSGLGPSRPARTGGCASLLLRGTDPGRSRPQHSSATGPRARVRDAVHRSDVSRARSRSCLV
jgi:hypothetical protein